MPTDGSGSGHSIEILFNGKYYDLYYIRSTNDIKTFIDNLERDDISQHDKLIALLTKITEIETPNSGIMRNKEKFRHCEGYHGIYEIKSDLVRIPCFFEGKKLIFTHGFFKGKIKEQRKEFKTAETIREQRKAYNEKR